MSSNSTKRIKTNSLNDRSDSTSEFGILNERVLILVFKTIKWDLQTLCVTAAVNRKLRAIAKRLLWRELCVYRAPRMLATFTSGPQCARYSGGWHALAKLMFFCCGCAPSRKFTISRTLPGHFVSASRFSKTSGRSFLSRKCRGDLLYVSDPCEHALGDTEDDLGVYRGVFSGFMRSKTRACLIGRQVELDARVRCPYCGARVWSMTTARLVPRSAARRLGSRDGRLEYFVCVNGHLHGMCWLLPLSSDEGGKDDDDVDDGSDDDDDDCEDQTAQNGNGSSSSTGEEIVIVKGRVKNSDILTVFGIGVISVIILNHNIPSSTHKLICLFLFMVTWIFQFLFCKVSLISRFRKGVTGTLDFSSQTFRI